MTRVTRKYKRLLSYLKPYWRHQTATFVVMVALTLLTLALPGAIQYMIDDLIPGLVNAGTEGVDFTPVIWFGLFLFGIYLFELLFSWLRDWLVSYVGAEIIKDMRLQLFGHLQRLSLGFHSRSQTGEMMSRLLSDAGRLQDLLTVTLLMLFTNILMLIGILIYLLNINWLLTLIAVIPVPITVFTIGKIGNRLNRLMTQVQQRMADLSAKLQESLMGIKTIKAFGREKAEEQELDGIMSRMNPLIVKASVASSLGVNLTQLVNMIGPIVVLAWGVYLVASGGLKLGELIAFYILLTYLYSPVRGLAETHIQVKSAMASADRIFDYLDLPPEITEKPDAIRLDEVKGEILLDHINFAHEDSRFSIENLSLHVAPREKVALVGPSGAGKTTIVNLIMRFFDPRQGRVLLDQVDLRDLAGEILRRHISLVEQEPLLFRMSVRDNIAFGYSEASDQEVIAAAQAANIHDFIAELPDGYDTLVGERGVTISGGERQRICLARAIVKNPSVLILDEATSALDSNSEQLIQKALADILSEKTAIIVAHRLATVQHADRIVVLDEGKVVDQGSHAELNERCELYRDLAQKQMLK